MGRNDKYNLPGNQESKIVKTLNGVCCYENALEEGKHDLDCDNLEANLEGYYLRTGKLPITLMPMTIEMAAQEPEWVWPTNNFLEQANNSVPIMKEKIQHLKEQGVEFLEDL